MKQRENGNMKINFSDVKVSEWVGISEEGTYTFKINGVDTRLNKNGDDMLVVECTTKDNESMRLFFPLVENMLWRLKKFVTAVDDSLLSISDTDELNDKLLNKKFIGVVKRQKPTFNAETQAFEESKFFEITQFQPVKA